MISVRAHAVSLAAVFLALAVGVVLGSSGVSDRLLGALADRSADLGGQVQTLTVERDELAAAGRGAEEFVARVGPAAVRGLLQDRAVTVVSVGAHPDDLTAVRVLLAAAGARASGEVALTPAVGDPARADQLRELTAQLLPAGARLPAASDTGSLAGGLLGGVLLAPTAGPDTTEPVLTGLATAGFVTPAPAPAPADLVLVLTGGALDGVDGVEAAAVTARLAAQLDRSGGGAVLAGRAGSGEATGAVGVARADPTVAAGLSTVDDVDQGSGRVAAVLALREQLDGRAGAYGSASTATGGSAPQA
jgi:hypothetical protein